MPGTASASDATHHEARHKEEEGSDTWRAPDSNPSILGYRWALEVGNCQQVDLSPLFHWLDPFILSTFNLINIDRKLLVMSPGSSEIKLSVWLPVILFVGSNNGVTPYQVRMCYASPGGYIYTSSTHFLYE